MGRKTCQHARGSGGHSHQGTLRKDARRAVIFAAGQPASSVPSLAPAGGAPRQWAYPVGYNIAQRPRASEQTSFEQLRNLAAL
jgi:hypothetical protein